MTVGPENPLQVEKDETAQLVCQVDAKPSVSTVKWTRNGRFIDTHFKHTIPRVTLQDSGTYVCSADNGLGQVGKAELKLDVLYGPVVSLEPEQREFNEGTLCFSFFLPMLVCVFFVLSPQSSFVTFFVTRDFFALLQNCQRELFQELCLLRNWCLWGSFNNNIFFGLHFQCKGIKKVKYNCCEWISFFAHSALTCM